MAVSTRVLESMKNSSGVRAMFETGIALKKEHGADKVFDFSLGNPDLDPPPEFHAAIKDILDLAVPFLHGYMPNAGYPDVRAAARNSSGFIGEAQVSLAAMKPNIAPVPIWTSTAQETAIMLIIRVTLR